MADFTPPFATSATIRRFPTSGEADGGFPCGPADQGLFNGMFYRIESEIGNVISAAGIVQSDANLAQLLEAINALIASATGGNPAGYVLMTQARARLPIFPDVQNTDGVIILTSPGTGQVRLPGGVDFNHRGIFQITTVQTDFPTAASKTYHLRWNPTDGFALKDLADLVYNPSVFAENNEFFDSAYDDMLVGRIVTNSSNVPTITNLANKAILRKRIDASVTPVSQGNNSYISAYNIPLNWSRAPDFVAIKSHVYASQVFTAKVQGGSNNVVLESYSRYSILHDVVSDWDSTPVGFGGLESTARGGAVA